MQSSKSTRSKTYYKALQRLCGLLLIIISVLSIRLTNDGTSALLLIPLGVWLLASKEQLMFTY